MPSAREIQPKNGMRDTALAVGCHERRNVYEHARDWSANRDMKGPNVFSYVDGAAEMTSAFLYKEGLCQSISWG
jgi:hypothetical protein